MCVACLAICFGFIMVTDADAQDKPQKKYKETVTTEDGRKISFEMVLIPGGDFLMGSPADEKDRKEHEGPQRKVRLDPFYLCTTETTIELFMAYYEETVTSKEDYMAMEEAKKNSEESDEDDVDAITGPTTVYGDMTLGYGRKNPAMGMTWNNAMTFCKWLSKRTGKKYRLPTEAEWEYACRAGTTNVFGFTNDPNQLVDFAWFEANADHETHEVAQKKPNAWDLYDMPGNVREWVYDFYSPTAYKETAGKTPLINPKGPKTGKIHVARGGDYSSPAEELRCAARAFEEKWWRSGDPQFPKSKWWLPEMDVIGFRIARSLEKDTKKSNK
jgi:formylglycine-generating enzyme required for sulfatase activity